LTGQVLDRLQKSSHRPVRRVSVAQHGQVLTLFGRVPNFYLKQVAQSIAAKVAGVQTVVNRIEVSEPTTRF